MQIERKKTRQIMVGDVPVGGDAAISVQSMTNSKTEDLAATIDQAQALENAGCEIMRISFPSQQAIANLAKIKTKIKIPLIADIHFKSDLAIKAMLEGADAIRINPGNLGGLKKFKEVLAVAKRENVSIRIGVNAGSLQPQIAKRYGGASPEALVESARQYLDFCQRHDFSRLKLSLKSSDVLTTIAAYRLASEQFDCPLHLGLTEAGTLVSGAAKSGLCLGILLAEGIGDTIRISLSDDPLEEVRLVYEILKALKLRRRGITVTACPTCSRVEMDVSAIASRIERMFSHCQKELKIAVMGCPVNGPGEAKEADIGLAGSPKGAMIFCRGKIVENIAAEEAEERFIKQIKKMLS